jgi:hypothetical protein
MTEPIDARGLMTDRGAGRYLLNDAWVIGIAIHHSVSGGSFFMSNAPTQGDELSHLEMIDRYHASKGWGGFGYHQAVFLSGRYYLCGNLNGARAHVASRNNQLVGLVLIGTFTTVLPPASQLAAAAAGVAYIRRTYPGRPIGPHRNWALLSEPTSCPGDTWASWLPALGAPPSQEEDWFDMATESQLRQIVKDETARLRMQVEWMNNIGGLEQRFVRATESGAVYLLMVTAESGAPKITRHWIPSGWTFLMIGGKPDFSNVVNLTEQYLQDSLGAPGPNVPVI